MRWEDTSAVPTSCQQWWLYRGQIGPPKPGFGQGGGSNTSQVALGHHRAPADSLSPRSCFGKVTARQVSLFSAGLWGQEGEILQSKIERGKKPVKEEAGYGYGKAYFFKNTSGSYVSLNFSAAAL